MLAHRAQSPSILVQMPSHQVGVHHLMEVWIIHPRSIALVYHPIIQAPSRIGPHYLLHPQIITLINPTTIMARRARLA